MIAGNGCAGTGSTSLRAISHQPATAWQARTRSRDKVQSKVVGAENVRAALKLVALGEAKFGVVYASDAKVEKQVRVVDTFPEDSHPPIVYPAAITKTADARQDGGAALAQAYLDYLRSDAAAAVFTKYGFTPLK